MPEVRFPGEVERKAFVEKLVQFRATLSSREQRMLDAMAITAFGTHEQDDVAGYGWFYDGAEAALPLFYAYGHAPSWEATRWGQAYSTVATAD